MGYRGPDGRWRETVFMSSAVATQVADDVAEMRRSSARGCRECGGPLRWDRDLGESVWVATCKRCGHRQDAGRA